MKDRKVQMEHISLYDRTHIIRRLEDMAAKGWMLEGIGTAFGWWHYRRIPPGQVRYAVCFRPKGDPWAAEPDPEQAEFCARCAENGWELAASWRELHIFSNRRPDPVPLETDPAEELKHMGALARFTFLPLLIIGLLFSVMAFFLLDTPEELLNEPWILLMGVWGAVLALPQLAEGLRFLCWHRRARPAAEQGILLDTPQTRGFRWIMTAASWLAGLGLLCYLPYLSRLQMIQLGLLLCVAILVPLLQAAWKRAGVPAQQNKGQAILVIILLSAAWAIASNAMPLEVPSWDQAPPLAAETILNGEVRQNVLPTDTPLWTYLSCRQWNETEEVSYTVAEQKIPGLRGLCRWAMLAGETPQEQDPAPWQAQAAVRLTGECYLLDYGTRLVRITFPAPPTPAQRQDIGMQLRET